MEKYYIIKINNWHAGYLKGDESDLENFLKRMGMEITDEQECSYEDLTYVFEKRYSVSTKCYGPDWTEYDRILGEVRRLIGDMGDYLETRIMHQIEYHLGKANIAVDYVSILESDGKVRDGLHDDGNGFWSGVIDGVWTLCEERGFVPFSKFDESRFWDYMREFKLEEPVEE